MAVSCRKDGSMVSTLYYKIVAVDYWRKQSVEGVVLVMACVPVYVWRSACGWCVRARACACLHGVYASLLDCMRACVRACVVLFMYLGVCIYIRPCYKYT